MDRQAGWQRKDGWLIRQVGGLTNGMDKWIGGPTGRRMGEGMEGCMDVCADGHM